MDEWIVGDAPSSGRTYVVHAVAPRFILEIVERDDHSWETGALYWLDDPEPGAAKPLMKEAGEVFMRWIQVAHEGA